MLTLTEEGRRFLAGESLAKMAGQRTIPQGWGGQRRSQCREEDALRVALRSLDQIQGWEDARVLAGVQIRLTPDGEEMGVRRRGGRPGRDPNSLEHRDGGGDFLVLARRSFAPATDDDFGAWCAGLHDVQRLKVGAVFPRLDTVGTGYPHERASEDDETDETFLSIPTPDLRGRVLIVAWLSGGSRAVVRDWSAPRAFQSDCLALARAGAYFASRTTEEDVHP